MTSLVIVESPAKAKTLAGILGRNYKVEASYGHIRDLPEKADQIPADVKKESWARLGVNVEKDFEPLYVVPKDKKKHIQHLKKALAGADEVLLATDEDREGESISWHVVEVLAPKVPIHRIVFHEITDEAIHAALDEPREIDFNLVRAQESRRILDRLYGYELSPVLWKKVRTGLSAGRVQSVAVRLCVLRERERRRFRKASYWSADAIFEKADLRFKARLLRLGGRRIATGQDFVEDTGELKKGSKALWLKDEDQIQAAIAGWTRPWQVEKVEKKPQVRRPSPPFTTATLQQEAFRKLRFSPRHTMRVAQRLYEGIDVDGDRHGLITYMRTDSVTLAGKALHEAEKVIRGLYGDDFTNGPRPYKTKSKSAQEAHEAIRPTEIARRPETLLNVLSGDEQRLYDLIWKRTVASQMTDARLLKTTVEIKAPVDGSPDTADDAPREGVFAATGTVVEFPGFLRAYVEGTDEPRVDFAEQKVLPALDEGESCDPVDVQALSRETNPPARFTEASLVKKLEAEGIGRPSTYAAILDTIQNRGYVLKQKGYLVPTFTAFVVTQLLEDHFRDYVDTQFTANMEQQLDDIANGELDWKSHLHDFWFGESEDDPGLGSRIAKETPDIDYPKVEIGQDPESGNRIVVKVGRYGPYLQVENGNGDRTMASVPDDVAPADLDVEEAVRLLEKAKAGAQTIGHDENGLAVYLAHGRFGPYVQLGETPERGSKAPKPRRASLPKDFAEEQVTLDLALKWLSLPRALGIDEKSGEEVVAASGRFGPYIKCGSETRSLTAEDDVYSVSLERAQELLAQPKARGRKRAAAKPLQDFGDGLRLLDGRFGPYLTDGEKNASLPKEMDPAKLTRDDALRVLEERGKPPKRRQRARKS